MKTNILKFKTLRIVLLTPLTKSLIITLFALFSLQAISQQNPIISSIISEVSIDSLTSQIRVFTGEDSTYVNGTKVLMKNRANSAGRNLSADYLIQKLESLGLTAVDQVYSTGRNIYAIQEGQVNPENIYIACGHYDAVTDYCADDNGSGVAVTLEAARIFSSYDFENTIIYAFWDQEEIGLVGSAYYADWAATNNLNILGVLNYETLAWDSDNDYAFDIHANTDPSTTAIIDEILSVKSDYSLLSVPGIFDNSPQTSDHASFWPHGYGAITFGGALFSNGGDLNPYYHTSNDRVEHFNMNYFHENGKLGIASLASLAVPFQQVSVPDPLTEIPMEIYPNPVNDILHFRADEKINSIFILDMQGRIIASFLNENNSINISELHPGPYFLNIHTDKMVFNKKLIKK